MPKRPSKPTNGKDLNQVAAEIVKAATRDAPTDPGGLPAKAAAPKNRHAVALGRLGGKRGGPKRAENLTAERRREIARQAARARWSKRADT